MRRLHCATFVTAFYLIAAPCVAQVQVEPPPIRVVRDLDIDKEGRLNLRAVLEGIEKTMPLLRANDESVLTFEFLLDNRNLTQAEFDRRVDAVKNSLQSPEIRIKVRQVPEQQPAKPTALEELQNEALKNNLDMRVSEAELRLAEARHVRDRGELIARVTNAVADTEAARAGLKEAEQRWERVKKLQDAKEVGADEVGAAQLTQLKFKRALEAAEIQLRLLLRDSKTLGVVDKVLDVEKLHAAALKNNPEMRVAEAQLRLAEATFAGARATLQAKVAAAHAEVQAARAAEAEGDERLKRAKVLFERKTISLEDYQPHVMIAQKLRDESIAVEARLHHMLGRTGAVKSPQPPKTKAVP